MGKSQKKKTNSRRQSYPFPPPLVVSSDDLGLYTDEELASRYATIDSERQRLGEDALPWEVELAYVQREQGIRSLGSQIHKDYMKKHGEEEL